MFLFLVIPELTALGCIPEENVRGFSLSLECAEPLAIIQIMSVSFGQRPNGVSCQTQSLSSRDDCVSMKDRWLERYRRRCDGQLTCQLEDKLPTGQDMRRVGCFNSSSQGTSYLRVRFKCLPGRNTISVYARNKIQWWRNLCKRDGHRHRQASTSIVPNTYIHYLNENFLYRVFPPWST